MRDQLVLRPIGIRMLETLSACCQRSELHIPGELIAVALLSLNQTARLKTNLYADYLVIAFGGQVRTSSRRPGWFVCALVRRTWRRPGAWPSVQGRIETLRGDDDDDAAQPSPLLRS